MQLQSRVVAWQAIAERKCEELASKFGMNNPESYFQPMANSRTGSMNLLEYEANELATGYATANSPKAWTVQYNMILIRPYVRTRPFVHSCRHPSLPAETTNTSLPDSSVAGSSLPSNSKWGQRGRRKHTYCTSFKPKAWLLAGALFVSRHCFQHSMSESEE